MKLLCDDVNRPLFVLLYSNQLIDNWEEAFAKMRISAQNLIEPKSERGDAAAKFHR